MSQQTQTDTLRQHAEEIGALRDAIRDAHCRAVDAVSPPLSLLKSVQGFALGLLKRSCKDAYSKPRLLIGLPLVALAWSYLLDHGDGFPYVQFAAILLLPPVVLFGHRHVRSLWQPWFNGRDRKVLYAAVPSMFIALKNDAVTGKLSGKYVELASDEEGPSVELRTALLAPYEGTTTPQVPTPYIQLHLPKGELLYLFNASTGSGYTRFNGSFAMKHFAQQHTEAFREECSQQGIADALAELSRIVQAQERPVTKTYFAAKPAQVPDNAQSNWDTLIISPSFKKELRTTVEMLRNAQTLRAQGIEPPRSLLLYGPPGTGKTEVARTLASMCGLPFISRVASDLKAQHVGKSAPLVAALFEEARANGPCILFVDEIEVVTAKRDAGNNDTYNKEIVGELLTQLDGANQSNADVFFVAATNFRESIDTALRSRFVDQKEVPLPDRDSRLKILQVFLRNKPIEAGIEDLLDELADSTEGKSGRDLRNMVDRAVKLATQRAVDEGQLFNVQVTREDLLPAKSEERKAVGIGPASWDTLILNEEFKLELQNIVQMLQNARVLRKQGLEPPTSLLLYGQPGTGKTEVARTLANMSGLAFVGKSPSDLKGQFLGHSAPKVQQVFEEARQAAPCILFIDELEVVAARRDASTGDSFTKEIVAEMLVQLDGVTKHGGDIFLVAATNYPESVDPALLSRFAEKREVPLPDGLSRRRLLDVFLEGKPVSPTLGSALDKVAEQTEGASGRDLKMLVEKAVRSATQRAFALDRPDQVLIENDDFS